MRLVIADTSPINYLLLIGHIDILPALFERVILPAAVRDELSHPKAPSLVRNWIAAPPPWVDVRPVPDGHDPALEALDAGEEAAILLAIDLRADLVLMDDEEGVVAAHMKGLEVTGIGPVTRGRETKRGGTRSDIAKAGRHCNREECGPNGRDSICDGTGSGDPKRRP